jgi:hypothetical protein
MLLPPHPSNRSVPWGASTSFQCTVRSDVEPHIQVRYDHPALSLSVSVYPCCIAGFSCIGSVGCEGTHATCLLPWRLVDK